MILAGRAAGTILEGLASRYPTRIDDCYLYGIFVSNADHVEIRNNVIGNMFKRGAAFAAGQFYSVVPDSGILIGQSKYVDIRDNSVRQGAVATKVFDIDKTCDLSTITTRGNVLETGP